MLDADKITDYGACQLEMYMALNNRKYPWYKLKKAGDTFMVKDAHELVGLAASQWRKRHGWIIKVHKAKGGTVVVRLG